MSKFFIGNFIFWGHLLTYKSENTRKCKPFNDANNAKIVPEQLKKNLEKVHKTIFLTPKMAKSRVSIWPKVPIFGSIFDPRALFLACWYQQFKKNGAP